MNTDDLKSLTQNVVREFFPDEELACDLAIDDIITELEAGKPVGHQTAASGNEFNLIAEGKAIIEFVSVLVSAYKTIKEITGQKQNADIVTKWKEELVGHGLDANLSDSIAKKFAGDLKKVVVSA